MPSPSVDILVPVWNSPFETRACLAALLTHSPEARLIVVDNGSTRETELMLDDFSESLGDQGLFMTCERNIGLVPAINRALAQSDREYAVIVRPQVLVPPGWLDGLLKTAATPGAGIVTPLFRGSGAPDVPPPPTGVLQSETFSISFAALLLKRNMRRAIGSFDENLDGGEWCLRDYIRRAEAAGFHTMVSSRPELLCGTETVFGSPERRQGIYQASRDCYLSRWGTSRHYCLYFGKELPTGDLPGMIELITRLARQGNRFTLLLHRRQHKLFRTQGWNALHIGIALCQLPIIGAMRSLARQVVELQAGDPDLMLVKGTDLAEFPGGGATIPFSTIADSIKNGYSAPQHLNSPEVP